MGGHKSLWLPSSVKTGGVALPTHVASEIDMEQRQMVEEMEDVTGALAYWSRELQDIFNEPNIKVILAKPNTTVVGLKPNYYHIVRMNPGTAAYIQPIETPNGEWLDLGSHVIDIALKADLWNDRTQRELRKQRERAEKARLAQKQRDAADRAGDFDERVRSLNRTQIRVTRNI